MSDYNIGMARTRTGRHRSLIPAVVAAFTMLTSTVSLAQPDPTTLRRCRRYAENAVTAYVYNRQEHCNYTGIQWHANTDGHFNWCVSVPWVLSPVRKLAKITAQKVNQGHRSEN